MCQLNWNSQVAFRESSQADVRPAREQGDYGEVEDAGGGDVGDGEDGGWRQHVQQGR